MIYNQSLDDLVLVVEQCEVSMSVDSRKRLPLHFRQTLRGSLAANFRWLPAFKCLGTGGAAPDEGSWSDLLLSRYIIENRPQVMKFHA